MKQANPSEPSLRDIEERLAKLESKKRLFDSLGVPIIKGIALAAITWYFTGRVSEALKERQLQLSNVTEMRGLLLEISKANTSNDDAEKFGYTLAAFGQPAVTPLIGLLHSKRDWDHLAAFSGLRAIGFAERGAICDPLIHVIRNRTQLFSWTVQRDVIRVLAEADCEKATKAIEEYRKLAEAARATPGLEAYRRIVAAQPQPNEASADEVAKECGMAVDRLHALQHESK